MDPEGEKARRTSTARSARVDQSCSAKPKERNGNWLVASHPAGPLGGERLRSWRTSSLKSD